MRRRRGNTFRQKDRIRTTLCKVQRYAQGATCSGRESLRLEDGGTNHRKDRLCLFLYRKGRDRYRTLPSAYCIRGIFRRKKGRLFEGERRQRRGKTGRGLFPCLYNAGDPGCCRADRHPHCGVSGNAWRIKGKRGIPYEYQSETA